jgi:hypothetical protein
VAESRQLEVSLRDAPTFSDGWLGRLERPIRPASVRVGPVLPATVP